MFEGLIDAAVIAWTYILAVGQDLINELISLIAVVRSEIANFTPTQRLVLWIQFGVGILTVIWIVFQFAWLRRLPRCLVARSLDQGGVVVVASQAATAEHRDRGRDQDADR